MYSGSDHAMVCAMTIGGAARKSSAAASDAARERDARKARHPVSTVFAANSAANTVLTGCLAFLASRSRAASLAAALLFLAAPPMVMAHTMAWSEPLYIAFVLCAIISLSAYLQMPRPWLLMAAAAAAALAFLTRYAGAAIVLAGIIALA